MPKRRDVSAARMLEALRRRATADIFRRPNSRDFGIAGPRPTLDDPDVWHALARQALTLYSEDKKLAQFFDAFSMDPRDPRSWRELLDELINIQDLVKPSAPLPLGRKKKWSIDRLKELLEAVSRIHQSDKRLTDLQACKTLVKQEGCPSYIKDSKPGALVRQVVRARKQLHQRALNRGERPPKIAGGRKNRAT